MRLNLTADQKKIEQYLRQRVKDFPVYINSGPGRDEDPIQQITAGYAVDQSSDFVLVFDTRRKAKCDGEWTRWFRDENILQLPNWQKGYAACCDDAKVTVLQPDGSKTVDSPEELVETLGEFLQETLCAAVEKGLFESLPIADPCLLTVEDFDGNYGWRSDQTTEPETPAQQKFLALQQQAKKLSKPKQIELWINGLDQLTHDSQDPVLYLTACDYARQLAQLGEAGVLATLKFVRKWAKDYEFTQVGRRRVEHLGSVVAFQALMTACDNGPANRQVEKYLIEIVRLSVAANADRKYWGHLPGCAATYLHHMFAGYPEPKILFSNNVLKNADQFLKLD